MGLLCGCPLDAAIPTIPISDCPESLGQVQKVIFQRVFSAAGVKNSIDISGTSTAPPDALATWTALIAAADGTKVQVSPYIQGPSNEAGAKREYGGGNETLGGIPIIIGREPSAFTANILRSPQDTIKELKKLMCENVGVYLIDEFGRVAGVVDDPASPTTFSPIPISGLFIGDKVLGGLESVDMNAIEWMFFPNWSDNLHIVTPSDFNAVTDLANV